MDLGGSLRRRRGGARRGGTARKGTGEGSGGPRRSGPGWGAGSRRILVGLVVLLLGGGGGYLYATQVVFPGAERNVAEWVAVPDLRGTSLVEASSLLEGQGFQMGRVDSIQHPEALQGVLVGQTPLPGQLLDPGGQVEVTLSLGPERRPVPDVTRLRADRAMTVLRTTGFEVTVDSVEADEPEGRVVATDPPSGFEVTLPAEIRIDVSLGPPLVTLPDLVGMMEERARIVLDSLGLAVGEVESRFRFGFSQGEVVEQFPSAGEEVSRGSPVRLVVGGRGLDRDDDGDG